MIKEAGVSPFLKHVEHGGTEIDPLQHQTSRKEGSAGIWCPSFDYGESMVVGLKEAADVACWCGKQAPDFLN